MAYNYYKAVKNDAKEYIVENMPYWDFEGSYFNDDVPTKDELYEYFNDELWAVDAVTGNGPNGGYYAYTEDARKSIFGNEDILIEVLEEFDDGSAGSYKRALINPIYADCTIRCWMLGQVLDEAVDELLAEKRFPFQKSVKSKSPRAKAKPKAKKPIAKRRC